MKKTVLAAGAALATFLAAGSVMAQQNRAARAADADADGRISRAEFVDQRVARLSAVDANRDGSVSVEERQSGIDTRRNQRASARFESLDKNGDGAISREEFTAPREDRADRGDRRQGLRGGGRDGGDHGRRGDRDRAAAGPVSIADVRARSTAQFDRLDADRDGFITAAERRAGRNMMRQDRRASRPAPASE